MLKRKIFSFLLVASLLLICAFFVCACDKQNQNIVRDAVEQDKISSRISFDKKYFYLGYDGYVSDEYYTFFNDGTATYTHIMKNSGSTTFHQVINFKWTYSGEGDCILIHNGTKMIKGSQDDAFGFSRVMRVSLDVVFWSASGENTYFICEDFTSQIPNYAKLLKD